MLNQFRQIVGEVSNDVSVEDIDAARSLLKDTDEPWKYSLTCLDRKRH